MNWITITWPMVAAVCLTMGLIELRISFAHQSSRAARLLFALSAFTVACISGLELAMMQTDVLAEWWPLMRLMDIAVGVMLVSLTAFVWKYFGTGRKWLAIAVPCFYALGLARDYIPGAPPGSGMTYQSFTGFRTVEAFGGANFHVAEGVADPWNVFPYLAVLALIMFAVDASLRFRRRDGGRRAVIVGGAILVFLLIAGVHSALVEIGIVNTPYMISWAYLAILIAMASGLNADVLAAAFLVGQLREGERRMDLASAAAKLGMWTWDIIGDTIWADSRARKLFGVSESESINRARFLSMLLPEDREAAEQAIESSLASDHDYEVEYCVLLPAGGVRCIAARGQVERNKGGKPIIMRGVVLDISDRRALDLDLQRMQDQLAHAARLATAGELTAAIAHELNQPLSAILSNAEAAELMLTAEHPSIEEVRLILADIRNDDLRASEVIRHLRSLLGKHEPEMESLDLNALARDVLRLVTVEARRRGVTLNIDAGEIPPVWGDRVQLQQVLLNLILNGMHALADTPAVLSWITVRTGTSGNGDVEVAVSDTGRGIPAEQLPTIFDSFTTSKKDGMGLGLSIARSIIEAHGGKIRAERNPGGGAIFRFTLPANGKKSHGHSAEKQT